MAQQRQHPLQGKGKQVHVVCKLDGVHTELIMTHFSDRVVVLITQLDKIAQLLTASADNMADVSASSDGAAAAYTVNTLLGKRDDAMAALLARQLIADIVKAPKPAPLLLALGLKPISDEDKAFAVMRTLMVVIRQHKVW